MRFFLLLTTFVLGWVVSYAWQIQVIKNLNSEILALKRQIRFQIPAETESMSDMKERAIKRIQEHRDNR